MIPVLWRDEKNVFSDSKTRNLRRVMLRGDVRHFGGLDYFSEK